MSGGGGGPIILKSIMQTLGSQYTATAKVRVWHTLIAAFLLGLIIGGIAL